MMTITPKQCYNWQGSECKILLVAFSERKGIDTVKMQSTDHIYVLGDGDKIREKIEYYLFKHDLKTLKSFSQNLTTAINKIQETAISTMNAQIIMAGGDDIFFYISSEKYKKELIQTLREIFYNITGVPISFGIGKTIEAAYINVRKAKTSKDIKIVEEEEP